MNLRPALLLCAALPFGLFPYTLNAATPNGTLTGKIGVQVTISGGCIVGNSNSKETTNEWGNINFGTYADLSSIINGSSLGSDGTNALTISCTSGLDPHLQLDSGTNETNNLRAMVSGTTAIPYRLYTDAAFSSEIAPNGSIAIAHDGNPHNIIIYGRILPSDQLPTAPTPGTYKDTVTATLTW